MPSSVIAQAKAIFLFGLVQIVAWPYSFSLETFTLAPCRRILQKSNDPDALRCEVIAFLKGKSHELRVVYLGSALAVAVTAGVFSWNSIGSTTWMAHASWFSSLGLAIQANVAANQVSALMHGLDTSGAEGQPLKLLEWRRILVLIGLREQTAGDSEAQKPRTLRMSTAMLIIWQSPVMLMAWSWAFFLMAFLLHATAPLRRDRDVGSNVKSAVFVLALQLVLMVVFVGSTLVLRSTSRKAEILAARDCEQFEADTW